MPPADPLRLAADFRRWAADPARTDDELFTVELLLAWGRTVWGWKHKDYERESWEARDAHRRERRLNPAYRARLDPQRLDQTVEVFADIRAFHGDGYDDRPVRDLAALRFLPWLEEVKVKGQIADPTPLAGLRALRTLHLNDNTLTDLGFLADLPALETLYLDLADPWPDLPALGTLPALRSFHYRGNLLALSDVPSLPAAREVQLSTGFQWSTPLRAARDLPALPLARLLKVEGLASLEGAAERFPAVVNADLKGPFRDLAPLAGLPLATFLRLEGERFRDLAPLARLPGLREVLLVREDPVDLDPLAEAPLLREVRVERCPVLDTEVAAFNAVLPGWDEEFAADPPRPLAPLRCFTYVAQHPEFQALAAARPPRPPAQADPDSRDPAFHAAEERWLPPRVFTALDTLLGPGWNVPSAYNSPTNLHLHRLADCQRLPEILQALREVSAGCRRPQNFYVSVEPHGDLADSMDDIAARQNIPFGERPFDAEQEREEHEDYLRHRREEREFREREHRLRLQKEQGLPINPAAFSPDTPQLPPPAGGTREDEDASDDDDAAAEDDDDAETDGDLLTADPEADDGHASDLGQELSIVVYLYEDTLWAHESEREDAEYFLGRPFENWHTLPEPPAERPRCPMQ